MNKIIVKAQNALANKKAEMYISKVIWVLAVIIVGMLLMWGVYNIFNGTVLPELDTTITDLFTDAKEAANEGDGYTTYEPSNG